ATMPRANDTFAVDDKLLVRRVIPNATSRRASKPYVHTCTQGVFEDVAHAIDGLGGATFTAESNRETPDGPGSQGMVAMASLREGGCSVPAHGRTNQAVAGRAGCFYEDAMLAWCYLREKRVE